MRTLAFLLLAALSLAGQALSTEELEKYLKDGKNIFFLDVREPKEIEENGSVEGYVNIPIGQLETRLNEVPKDKLIITLCSRGVRAARAGETLTKAGYKMVGSCAMNDYQQKGKKLVYPKSKQDKQD